MDKRQEIEALRERVKQGNQKLNEAWTAICLLDHKEQRWSDEVEKWHQANVKLSALCSHLILLGFNDCLYLDDNSKKTKKCGASALGCRVCPSIREYWLEEMDFKP